VHQVRGASSGTEGVTALALRHDILLVGGNDGGVKLWLVGRYSVKLQKSVR